MNSDLAQKLEELKQRDLQKRSQLISENRLYGTYDREMQKVHIENAIALDEIVSKYGWTGISLVGFQGCQTAWLIAQHSICTPDLQRKFLKAMTEAAAKGDVPKRQVAMLTDRIRFNEGRPQIYGTVLDWDKNGVLGCEIEDVERSICAERKLAYQLFRNPSKAMLKQSKQKEVNPQKILWLIVRIFYNGRKKLGGSKHCDSISQ
ncbi:MAG: DUF6624 domain-containing protein [Cyanobacteria bacterium P01_G01_bin.19]